MPTALITGGTRGFGLALAKALVDRDWSVIVDGRDPRALDSAAVLLGARTTAIAGDVTDKVHRRRLIEAVDRFDGLDLLVNNASSLGPTPLPGLDRYPLAGLRDVLETNLVAPLALIQSLLTNIRSASGKIVNISSDAALEPYEGWGGYGASKAALDLISAVLGEEQKSINVYAFDPGDMRTDMHQAAYPGEDISDRPRPEAIVPALLTLLDHAPPSGRYRASDFLVAAEVAS